MKKIEHAREARSLWALALLAFGVSLYIAVRYASQLPLDTHSFRQTQTALTSYWFIQQGWQLAYQTPVAGAPWSIPFEFPIYQAIVAFLAKAFTLDLNVTGRMVSYGFLVLTILPVVSITRRLKLPEATSLYFCAILFSMPVYVYWSRTVMIETAALFFSIAAVKFFLDFLLDQRGLRASLAFIIFATLAILQKATTALPILAVLAVAYAVFELENTARPRLANVIKRSLLVAVLFLIPLSIGYAWVSFTDHVKLNNPLGQQLTSAALGDWNWGTLAQRVSMETWSTVLWERVLRQNLGASLGMALLLAPFVMRVERSIRSIILALLALGLLPILLFTNLHWKHDYYQSAIDIFFAYAVAIALAVVVTPRLGKRAALCLLAIVMVSNYLALSNGYLRDIKEKFTKANRHLAIGKILNRELPPGMEFVAFGNDWSSTFAYISERKSLTAPPWLRQYDQVVNAPDMFVDRGNLGALVSCTPDNPDPAQIVTWAARRGGWKLGESHGCLIVTPEKTFTGPIAAQAQSRGYIDSAQVQTRAGQQLLVVEGWVSEADGSPIQGDIVLRISGKGRRPIFLQSLKVPRPDVNHALNVPDDADRGFSRIVANTFEPGEYDIAVLRDDGGTLRACGIQETIHIP